MRYYVSIDNDSIYGECEEFIMVGTVKELSPIFKSVRRYDFSHRDNIITPYTVWQDLRKKHGVIALVFNDKKHLCTVITDADVICECIITDTWEEGRPVVFNMDWIEEV